MAGKKEPRSSKTDHVLHLLSGIIPEQENPSPTPAPPVSDSPAKPQAETPAPSSPPASSPPVEPIPAPVSYPAEIPQHRSAPILEVAHTNHDALAESIRQALEEHLQQELAAQEEEVLPPVKPAKSAEPPAATVQEPASSSSVPASSPTLQNPAPAQAESPSAHIQYLPDGSVWMDVMPILVEEQLDHYIEMFDLCHCSRCRADVQALALSGLSPKYVVLEKEKANSMLGLFRHQYQSTVSIELTKACNIVKKHPRHQ